MLFGSKKMHRKRPSILLLGAGRFGKNHLRILQNLDDKKIIDFMGVVTRKNAKNFLTPEKLKNIDAVDIVTPYETHYDLVRKCLPYTNVFVEKPLAEKVQQAQKLSRLAKRHGRMLMVGHVYRYHSKVNEILKIIKGSKLRKIDGIFTSPKESFCGKSAPLEMLHWFDVIDFLIGRRPKTIWADGDTRLCRVSLRYPGNIDSELTLGWRGDKKERLLKFFFDGKAITLDLQCKMTKEPLRDEILVFVDLISGKKIGGYPDANTGARIISIANRVEDILKKPKHRIAVIGGGLFGTTAALMLSKIGNVTLFERHNNLFQEATHSNQYRHHMGYHYPRSLKTIREIQQATENFESFYKKSIIQDFPAYYGVSKKDSRLSARNFLRVCKQAGLPYKKTVLPGEILNLKEVDVVIKTSEGVIDFDYLKKDIKRRIKSEKIKLRLGAEVTGVCLNEVGKKVFTVGKNEEAFDYVVNATYANHNSFCRHLGFPGKDLELRLKEIIVIKLPLKKKMGVMIIDGPFATFIPMGNSGLYTFGDALLSIHKIGTSRNALKVLEKKMKTTKTRWGAIQKRCEKWFPFLKDATYVDSMFAILPIEKWTKKTDARSTELTSHGFGCYSILSGKLITAVKTAKEVVDIIKMTSFNTVSND
ncbi:MAG: hypothetical protein A3F12_00810 [Gammaproteobacteria bacterium RIFCSPHIGHO2_12_FULL_38_14]|nr:MAG: hypothetical protein A3F12_00810 [Gammaproteobacteria bacterium RIFCSPHIGHO2_12_FULL_38_14]